MNTPTITWNHGTLDATLSALEHNANAHVIYIEGDDEYDEHIALTISQADSLMLAIAMKLAVLYEALEMQEKEAD